MRQTRLYTIFTRERQPNGKFRYTQASDICLKRDQAVRFFQNRLLAPYLGADLPIVELRPVKGS